MKIEWWGTDVTAVGSPGRAEHAILGVILAGYLAHLQSQYTNNHQIDNLTLILAWALNPDRYWQWKILQSDASDIT